MILLLFSSAVLAEDGLYQLPRIDYFAMRAVKRGDHSLMPLWDEADVPAVVLDLLNDPNAVSARHYLEWSRERLLRVARAQAAIDAFMSAEMKP
ncbi:MAG: hypothetical protein V2A70_01580 [Candidatus Omnitrophota bacterium]